MLIIGKIKFIDKKHRYALLQPNDKSFKTKVVMYSKSFTAAGNKIEDYKVGDEIETEIVMQATRVFGHVPALQVHQSDT